MIAAKCKNMQIYTYVCIIKGFTKERGQAFLEMVSKKVGLFITTELEITIFHRIIF